MLSCDVVLALALFALLKPVNSTLALLGSLDPGFLVPDIFAELSAALWLAFRGVRLPT
jgi:hypothetical protein